MIRLTALAAVVTALLLAGSAGAVTHPKLVGVVGKNNASTISLKFNGNKVRTLKAGTYTLVIHDDSASHDYLIRRPSGKSSRFTTLQFVGTKTFTITLVPGKYKAYCQPHEAFMFQRFTVIR